MQYFIDISLMIQYLIDIFNGTSCLNLNLLNVAQWIKKIR